MLAFDEEHDQYLWFQVGWSGKQRVRGITIHVRIKDSKIWIEEDWTEEGIANALVKAGVPQTEIVLAFHPPQVRGSTNERSCLETKFFFQSRQGQWYG